MWDQQRDVVIVFWAYVFGQFDARVPKFDAVFSVQSVLYKEGGGGKGLPVKFWDSSLK